MDRKVRRYLHDIEGAIREIESYFERTGKNFKVYQSDTMLRRAVERDLEIIGEAINRIKKRDPGLLENITASQSIIGLRNHVAHAYDSVSDEMIWSVVVKHLPVLQREVEALL